MNAVERLQAAIDKLEKLRADSTPGEWIYRGRGCIAAGEYGDVVAPGRVDCMAYCNGSSSTIEGDNLDADADLIVTLHRTIDAQLAILAYGATLTGRIPDEITTLADAILGDA